MVPTDSDGPPARGEQSWDPALYARDARFVSELGQPVVDLLEPRDGERILDLGCGDGVLTQRIAATGAHVIGIDSSPEQVAAARKRGLDALVVAGDSLTFVEEFDAVFSNAALHWIKAPDRVIVGVWRALLPGGRFIAEMGGAGNIAKIVAALYAELDRLGLDGRALNPWFFPGPDDYRARLTRAGFRVAFMDLFPRPTKLPGPIEDWLAIFAKVFLDAVPADERAAFAARVAERLAPELRDEDGVWTADYVRLRFRAVK